jgi:hypothetical protein
MNEFKRGINDEKFINALNELYKDKSSFWHMIINDKDLFIAIRNEYLNIYYKGQSISRLYYKNCILGATHKKYLGIKEPGYFYSENGKILNEKSIIKSLSEINQLKENIKIHVGKEKAKSYTEIINNEKCILDVEIAFVRPKVGKPVKKSEYEISSIDYLAFEYDSNDEPILVFYEAKHFTNSEIRSRSEPKVIGQIKRYEQALKDHSDEIIRSYKLISKNLLDLHILDKRNYKGTGISKKDITIDFEPRLIIFGNNQNSVNDKHLQKLHAYFGKRLILRD